MPICYLHAGTPKTGTSAIQTFLRDHRAELLQEGYLIPTQSGPSGNHWPLIVSLDGRPVPGFTDAADRLRAEINAHPHANVIISAEAMERQFNTTRMSPVASFFAEAGYDIVIVIFLRDQVHRMNSHYAFLGGILRTRSELSDFAAYFILSGVLNYDRWFSIANLNKAHLIARPYTENTRALGAVPEFMTALGLVNIARPKHNSINDAPGPLTLAVCREVLARLSGRGMGLRDHLEHLACGELVRAKVERTVGMEPAYFGFDTQQAAHIRTLFAASNALTADRAWGKAWNDEFPIHDPSANELNLGSQHASGSEYNRIVQEVASEIMLRSAKDAPRTWEAFDDIISGIGRTLYSEIPY